MDTTIQSVAVCYSMGAATHASRRGLAAAQPTRMVQPAHKAAELLSLRPTDERGRPSKADTKVTSFQSAQ